MKKKAVNPFKFGDKVLIPGATTCRLVTAIRGPDRIAVLNIPEITAAQRADWLRTPIKGEFVFVPGLTISIEGVQLWSEAVDKVLEAA